MSQTYLATHICDMWWNEGARGDILAALTEGLAAEKLLPLLAALYASLAAHLPLFDGPATADVLLVARGLLLRFMASMPTGCVIQYLPYIRALESERLLRVRGRAEEALRLLCDVSGRPASVCLVGADGEPRAVLEVNQDLGVVRVAEHSGACFLPYTRPALAPDAVARLRIIGSWRTIGEEAHALAVRDDGTILEVVRVLLDGQCAAYHAAPARVKQIAIQASAAFEIVSHAAFSAAPSPGAL